MDVNNLNRIWPEWRIVRVLGKGSFGTVYAALRRSHGVESWAAIKVISVPQNEYEINVLRSEGFSPNDTRIYYQNMVESFIGEIKLMESFKGVQNIVCVEDYKVIQRTDRFGWDIYIRMELLTPFSGYAASKTMTEAEVIKLGSDICTALELCSRRNVIHRDIKPDNIFINDFGDFKLGDFGIARKLENVTSGLSQKGTYTYMAPEVERGINYDNTVDIYSLGLVLYRYLNQNHMPFIETDQQNRDPNQRMLAVKRRMSGEPLPPPCDASPEMAQIILCACAYNPEDRFQTPSAMKEALNNVEVFKNRSFDPVDNFVPADDFSSGNGNEETEGTVLESVLKIVAIGTMIIVIICALVMASFAIMSSDQDDGCMTAQEQRNEKLTDSEDQDSLEIYSDWRGV